jgi:hypothetical protein
MMTCISETTLFYIMHKMTLTYNIVLCRISVQPLVVYEILYNIILYLYGGVLKDRYHYNVKLADDILSSSA